jgi:hypothetical protein
MKPKPARNPKLSFDDLVAGARQLSAAERFRLIEQVLPKIGPSGSIESGSDRTVAVTYLVKAMQALFAGQPSSAPKRSFYGLWADLGKAPSAEEIDEVRAEAWANFARADI